MSHLVRGKRGWVIHTIYVPLLQKVLHLEPCMVLAQWCTPLAHAVLVKVAGWRVFGGLGLSCGGKNSLGRADFSWILEYLEEKSWENIGIKNFHIF